MKNFSKWIMSEAEASKTGKQDVITYLVKNWAPLANKGNYFVYVPETKHRPDLQTPIDHKKKDPREFLPPHGSSSRRDVNPFNYSQKGTTAYGLSHFLKLGLNVLDGGGDLINKNTVMLLTVNKNAKIQCLDEKSDQTNPRQWVTERFEDYKNYASKLKISPESRTILNREIAIIEKQVQDWYRGSNRQHYSANDALYEKERLLKMQQLINVEMPRLIGHYANVPKMNMMTALNGSPPPFKQMSHLQNPPNTKSMKGMSYAEVDILSHSCPMSNSEWVTVFNPKSIRVVDSVVVDHEFSGIRMASKGGYIIPSHEKREHDSIQDKIRSNLSYITNNLEGWIENLVWISKKPKKVTDMLASIRHTGRLASSLAKSQPDMALDLRERLQHILDQIMDHVESSRDLASGQTTSYGEKISAEEGSKETEAWNSIEAAFLKAIESIQR